MLEFLAIILEFDEVQIWLGGVSSVLVMQGVPEEGAAGPLRYNICQTVWFVGWRQSHWG